MRYVLLRRSSTRLLAALAMLALASPSMARAQQGETPHYRIPLKRTPIPVGVFEGKVTNKKDEPLPATLTIAPEKEPDVAQTVNADPHTGEYQVQLRAGDYLITVSAPGYLAVRFPLSIKDRKRARAPVKLVPEPPPEKRDEVAEQGSLSVRYDEAPELATDIDESKVRKVPVEDLIRYGAEEITVPESGQRVLAMLVKVLNAKESAVRLVITGHTRDLGDRGLEERRSLRRATYVRNYLIGQGIDGTRLAIEGAGAKKPRSEDDPAENDRVEFTLWILQE